MENIYAVLLMIGIAGFASAIMIITHRSEKRGCGRGCATCGNREICYKKQRESQKKP